MPSSDAQARPFRPPMPMAWREVLDQSPLLAPVADFYLDRYELLNLTRYRAFALKMQEREAAGETLTKDVADEVLASL